MFKTFVFSCAFVVIFLCSRVFAADPVPDIKVNGSGSPATISTGDNLTVAVSLTPGSRIGEDADWWLAVSTPFGWYHFDVISDSWMPDLTVTYQGSLFDLPESEVLNMSGLPVGVYTFYFGVDMTVDGAVNNPLFYDSVAVTVSNIGTIDFKLPDTGLEEIFVPGDDGSHKGNPLSYTEKDGIDWVVIIDNNTKLMWPKNDVEEERTWEESCRDCKNSSYAGYDDWRPPNYHELLTLLHLGKGSPAIDEIFPNINPKGFYWASNPYVGDRLDEAWGVNFRSGNVYTINKYALANIKCVRGKEFFPRFINNGNGTVTEMITKLMWQQKGSETELTWEESCRDCKNSSYAGYDDWRLTNVKELMLLVDVGLFDPAINEVFFLVNSLFYWTSTTDPNNPRNAYGVSFLTGVAAILINKTGHSYVWCVRGPD